jgi:hypothetical protein
MKKFISYLGYFASLIGLLYYVFFVDEPTNKQLMSAIFYSVVIIVLSIQKEQN